MKKLLLLIIVTFNPLHGMGAMETIIIWEKGPQIGETIIKSTNNFIDQLHTPLVDNKCFPHYSALKNTPGHTIKTKQSLVYKCMAVIIRHQLNFKILPKTVQKQLTQPAAASNWLNSIIDFWKNQKLVLPRLYDARMLNIELDKHYNAIAKALLSGAQPNPDNLLKTLRRINEFDNRPLDKNNRNINAPNSCFELSRKLIL